MLCVMSMCPCVCSVVSGPLSFCLFPLLLARSCNCCMLFAFAFVRIILHVISFWLIPPLFLFLVPKLSWWPLGSKPGFCSMNLKNDPWSPWSQPDDLDWWLQVLKFIFSGRCDGGSRDTAHSKLLMYWFSQLLSWSSLISWFAEVIFFFKSCSVFIYDQHLMKQTVTLKVSQWSTYIQYLYHSMSTCNIYIISLN